MLALIAFRMLERGEQAELISILKSHPKFDMDLKPTGEFSDEKLLNEWLIGRAGFWPDIARSSPEFNRPTWHYQLGASEVLGDRQKVNLPENPGPLPQGANFNTQELYVLQAIELSLKTLADKGSSPSDCALAVLLVGAPDC